MIEKYAFQFVIWLPILSSLLVFIIRHYIVHVLMSMSILAIGFILLLGFDPLAGDFQFYQKYTWSSLIGFNYEIGLDGYSLPLVLLNNLIFTLVILHSSKVKRARTFYCSLMFAIQGLVNAAFASLDLLAFYILFELQLIPMILLIGIWGGLHKNYAAIKFFIYTFVGSVLLLLIIIYLKTASPSSSILSLVNLNINPNYQIIMFALGVLAFMIKIPMVPVHSWLPLAHVEAPTGGSVILAAILLKLGAFGIIRFLLPIFPVGAIYLSEYFIILSLVAIVYIGIIAIEQQDLKKLIAYSSISHMGFVTLGIFSGITYGSKNIPHALLAINGAYFQLISHGLISAAMFFSVGVIYDRLQTKHINSIQGIVNKAPIFAVIAMILFMANSGLPGTSGFVAEFMIIVGCVVKGVFYAAVAATTLVIAAGYNLYLYKRVFFGVANKQVNEVFIELDLVEKLILLVLAFFIIFLGIYPNAVNLLVNVTSYNLLKHFIGI